MLEDKERKIRGGGFKPNAKLLMGTEPTPATASQHLRERNLSEL